MSQVLIQQYLNQLRDLRKVSGTHRESVVREAFKDLLKGWARSQDLIFVPEYEIATPAKDRRYVDGALVHTLRVPFGYWEAKDEKDDLDAEIATKLRRGYPQDNIIFEDSTKAILVQDRQEVYRSPVDDVKALEKLLDLFFGYERTEITEFRKAVEQFKTDLPMVLDTLRSMIERAHKRHMRRGTRLIFDAVRIVTSVYRPFVTRFTYFSPVITHRPYQNFSLFPSEDTKNIGYSFSVGKRTGFGVIAVDRLPSLDMFLPSAGQLVCLWRYNQTGQRIDNITDWALNQFRKHYQFGSGKTKHLITKEAIFHYVYAVLHDPVYREKYALNLKREFPRIPFYKDFWQWANWGKELMDLHIGYESVTPAKLKRIDVPDEKARKADLAPKCLLKADKDGGRIIIDSETTLAGIPTEAWDYKLGNRSALEWILDQYKERKPKDPTIREKFNTYRFADYKEKVIGLLMRVTTVSVSTVAVINSMKNAAR